MAQGTFVEAKVTNIEIKSHALLEIANGMHSPICPNLVEFSTCVPPDDFHMVIWASMKVPWLEPFLIMKCLATFFFVSIQSRNTQMSFKPRYVSKNLLKKSYKYFLPNETIQQHFLLNNFSIFSTTRNVLKNWKFKKELKLWFLLTLTLVNFWPNPLKSFWKNCKLKSWATLLIDFNSIKKPCLPREKFF